MVLYLPGEELTQEVEGLLNCSITIHPYLMDKTDDPGFPDYAVYKEHGYEHTTDMDIYRKLLEREDFFNSLKNVLEPMEVSLKNRSLGAPEDDFINIPMPINKAFDTVISEVQCPVKVTVRSTINNEEHTTTREFKPIPIPRYDWDEIVAEKVTEKAAKEESKKSGKKRRRRRRKKANKKSPQHHIAADDSVAEAEGNISTILPKDPDTKEVMAIAVSNDNIPPVPLAGPITLKLKYSTKSAPEKNTLLVDNITPDFIDPVLATTTSTPGDKAPVEIKNYILGAPSEKQQQCLGKSSSSTKTHDLAPKIYIINGKMIKLDNKTIAFLGRLFEGKVKFIKYKDFEHAWIRINGEGSIGSSRSGGSHRKLKDANGNTIGGIFVPHGRGKNNGYTRSYFRWLRKPFEDIGITKEWFE